MTIQFDNIIRVPGRGRLTLALILAALSACGGGEADSGGGPAGGGGGGGGSGGGVNAPPSISGTPAANVQVGAAYSFAPVASDPEGAALSFSIQNKPAWATFSTSTGSLTGTPGSTHTGTSSNILITVSDGTNSVTLAAFSLTVNAATANLGSLRVDWTAPTQNTDGSSLADLAGFRVYYGSSAGAMTQSVNVPGASSRNTTLTNLAPGTYFVSIAAYSEAGTESVLSNPASGAVP